MAENVYLYLKANGIDIKGDSSQTSLGRADSIECVSYEQSVVTPRDASGTATGRRHYNPLTIRKRIDRSSPLLARALATNETMEGLFKFFRPNPAGDGTTEQFYTVQIRQAHLASIKQYVLDTVVPASAALPALEEITFVFRAISWTYVNGGISYEDALDQNR